MVSHLVVTLCNPWTTAHQAPLSMGFSRQEYGSGLTCPPPGDIPRDRIHLQCRRHWFDSWVGKIPWRKDRLPTVGFMGFLVVLVVKNLSDNAGDLVCSSN